MGNFEQFTNNIAMTPIEFTFRGTKDLISKFEALSGEKLKDGWHYCIRDHKSPNGSVHKLLVKISVEEDSWFTLGVITNYSKDLKLPKFDEFYSQRKVYR